MAGGPGVRREMETAPFQPGRQSEAQAELDISEHMDCFHLIFSKDRRGPAPLCAPAASLQNIYFLPQIRKNSTVTTYHVVQKLSNASIWP